MKEEAGFTWASSIVSKYANGSHNYWSTGSRMDYVTDFYGVAMIFIDYGRRRKPKHVSRIEFVQEKWILHNHLRLIYLSGPLERY